MAEWSFGRVQGGIVDGFEHSGIDLFKGHRLDSMIRECIQNSLDAKDDEVDGPVRVALTINDLDLNGLGVLNGMDTFLQLGQTRSQQTADQKAIPWYKDALKTVASSKIRMLGFHDANTIGLFGSSDKSTVQKSGWLALVAGQGVNLGQAADGLGGFGHGSNAAFAMSKLRLAYYLSRSIDENEDPITRFQGHCLLQTLFPAPGEFTTRDGFFGSPSPTLAHESSPLTGAAIPGTFGDIREGAVGDGKGTSVYICDPFVDDLGRSWQEILVSVVANFGFALYVGNLSVSLGDGTVIDKDTITDAYKRIRELQKDDDTVKNLEIEAETWRNLDSLETMLNPDFSGQGKTLAIPNFGQVYWFLRVAPNASGKRIAVAREPGMIITDRAPELGRNALAKYKDFDLLVCVRRGGLGQSGAEVIKSYEDPTHKKLEENRVPPAKRSLHRTKYKAFQQSLKSQILTKHALADADEIEEIEIDGLLNPAFLGDESDKDGMAAIEIVKGAKSKRTPKWPTPSAGTDGPGSGAPPGGTGGTGRPGGGDGAPPPAVHGPFTVDNVKYERTAIGRLQVIPSGKAATNSDGDFVEVRIVGHQLVKGNTRLALFIAGETETSQIDLRLDAAKQPKASEEGTVAFGSGSGGRHEITVWLRADDLNLAFGGVLYRGI
jgi:hypothetical protein